MAGDGAGERAAASAPRNPPQRTGGGGGCFPFGKCFSSRRATVAAPTASQQTSPTHAAVEAAAAEKASANNARARRPSDLIPATSGAGMTDPKELDNAGDTSNQPPQAVVKEQSKQEDGRMFTPRRFVATDSDDVVQGEPVTPPDSAARRKKSERAADYKNPFENDGSDEMDGRAAVDPSSVELNVADDNDNHGGPSPGNAGGKKKERNNHKNPFSDGGDDDDGGDGVFGSALELHKDDWSGHSALGGGSRQNITDELPCGPRPRTISKDETANVATTVDVGVGSDNPLLFSDASCGGDKYFELYTLGHVNVDVGVGSDHVNATADACVGDDGELIRLQPTDVADVVDVAAGPEEMNVGVDVCVGDDGGQLQQRSVDGVSPNIAVADVCVGDDGELLEQPTVTDVASGSGEPDVFVDACVGNDDELLEQPTVTDVASGSGEPDVGVDACVGNDDELLEQPTVTDVASGSGEPDVGVDACVGNDDGELLEQPTVTDVASGSGEPDVGVDACVGNDDELLERSRVTDTVDVATWTSEVFGVDACVGDDDELLGPQKPVDDSMDFIRDAAAADVIADDDEAKMPTVPLEQLEALEQQLRAANRSVETTRIELLATKDVSSTLQSKLIEAATAIETQHAATSDRISKLEAEVEAESETKMEFMMEMIALRQRTAQSVAASEESVVASQKENARLQAELQEAQTALEEAMESQAHALEHETQQQKVHAGDKLSAEVERLSQALTLEKEVRSELETQLQSVRTEQSAQQEAALLQMTQEKGLRDDLELALKEMSQEQVELTDTVAGLQARLDATSDELLQLQTTMSLNDETLSLKQMKSDTALQEAHEIIAELKNTITSKSAEVALLEASAAEAQCEYQESLCLKEQQATDAINNAAELATRCSRYEVELSSAQRSAIELNSKLTDLQKTADAQAKEISQLQATLSSNGDELASKQAAADSALTEAQAKVSTLESELKERETKLHQEQSLRTNLQGDLDVAMKEISENSEAAASEAAALGREIDALTVAKADAESQVEELRGTIVELESRVASKSTEVTQLQATLASSGDELASKQAAADSALTEAQAKVSTLESELKERETKLHQEQSLRTSLQGDLDVAMKEISENGEAAASEAAALGREIDALTVAKADAESQVEELRGTIVELESRVASKSTEVTQLQATLASSGDNLASEAAVLEQQVQEQQDKVESLTTQLSASEAALMEGKQQVTALEQKLEEQRDESATVLTREKGLRVKALAREKDLKLQLEAATKKLADVEEAQSSEAIRDHRDELAKLADEKLVAEVKINELSETVSDLELALKEMSEEQVELTDTVSDLQSRLDAKSHEVDQMREQLASHYRSPAIATVATDEPSDTEADVAAKQREESAHGDSDESTPLEMQTAMEKLREELKSSETELSSLKTILKEQTMTIDELQSKASSGPVMSDIDKDTNDVNDSDHAGTVASVSDSPPNIAAAVAAAVAAAAADAEAKAEERAQAQRVELERRLMDESSARVRVALELETLRDDYSTTARNLASTTAERDKLLAQFEQALAAAAKEADEKEKAKESAESAAGAAAKLSAAGAVGQRGLKKLGSSFMKIGRKSGGGDDAQEALLAAEAEIRLLREQLSSETEARGALEDKSNSYMQMMDDALTAKSELESQIVQMRLSAKTRTSIGDSGKARPASQTTVPAPRPASPATSPVTEQPGASVETDGAACAASSPPTNVVAVDQQPPSITGQHSAPEGVVASASVPPLASVASKARPQSASGGTKKSKIPSKFLKK